MRTLATSPFANSRHTTLRFRHAHALTRLSLANWSRKAIATTRCLQAGGEKCASNLPFCFETGIGLFAKRTPRPFPPPFLSPPSGSFSDPLSTHHQSRYRRARVNGDIILGVTNGDDAVYASESLICANDGVGAWAARPRGHAGLWARLILHFWAKASQEDAMSSDIDDRQYQPDSLAYLQQAFENTVKETEKPVDCQGTTTACGAQLYYRSSDEGEVAPTLHVVNLGDSQAMVLRPRDGKVIYKTTEQWHWFDCPRQLGTNSPDTPTETAVVDIIDVQVGDVVLVMTDGVIDNLWEHEIVSNITQSLQQWEEGQPGRSTAEEVSSDYSGMRFAAERLVAAAKKVALDPFAASPYMEHAIEEGLASEGGKPDDISVVAAIIVANEAWHKR